MRFVARLYYCGFPLTGFALGGDIYGWIKLGKQPGYPDPKPFDKDASEYDKAIFHANLKQAGQTQL